MPTRRREPDSSHPSPRASGGAASSRGWSRRKSRGWWQRGNARLARYQDALLLLGLVLVTACVSLFLIRLLGFSWTAFGSDPDVLAGTIVRERETRGPPAPPRTVYREAPPEVASTRDAEATSDGDAPLAPGVDWTDARLRRRAASMLCLEDNIAEARELLEEGNSAREVLSSLTTAHRTDVLNTLDAMLSEAETALASTGNARPGQGVPGSEPASPAAAEGRARRLVRWGETLSDRRLLRRVVNLHCQLRERTRAPHPYLKLLLESSFPAGSLARKIYLDRDILQPDLLDDALVEPPPDEP